MYRFFECKYSFKLTFQWSKPDFYTRVHKMIYLLLLFKSQTLWHCLIYYTSSFIRSVLELRTENRTLFNFLTKQNIFLNSNPEFNPAKFREMFFSQKLKVQSCKLYNNKHDCFNINHKHWNCHIHSCSSF